MLSLGHFSKDVSQLRKAQKGEIEMIRDLKRLCHAETEELMVSLEKTEVEHNNILQIQKEYLIFLKCAVHYKSGLKFH